MLRVVAEIVGRPQALRIERPLSSCGCERRGPEENRRMGRPAGRTGCVLLAVGHRAACDLRASWTSWMRLPQVSFSIAMMEAVTSVGGIVNWAPRALIRS